MGLRTGAIATVLSFALVAAIVPGVLGQAEQAGDVLGAANDAGGYSICGTVYEQTTSQPRDAIVIATNEDEGSTYVNVTETGERSENAFGYRSNYCFTGLPAGSYSLLAIPNNPDEVPLVPSTDGTTLDAEDFDEGDDKSQRVDIHVGPPIGLPV